MTSPLRALPLPTLRDLAAAIAAGRVRLPCSLSQLEDRVPPGREQAVAEALNDLAQGAVPDRVATVLRDLAEERASVQSVSDRVDLVWSGPEAAGSLNLDTAVVVRGLLEKAKKSVLIATYVLDQGEKARAILEPLAKRIDAGEPLDVRLFVNVEREWEDSRPDSEILAKYAARFRDHVWPGEKLPPVFYDPRALAREGGVHASLHAKCIVIDDATAFVTSANFTEAAQLRNIEVGVIVRDAAFATSLGDQFERLVEDGRLVRLDLG